MNKNVYGYIYMIKNTVNGKIYFGQTIRDFDSRYMGDIAKHTHNDHLRCSIEKYGIENFEITKEFDVAYSKEELDALEDLYICIYDTMNYKYGFNKTRGGIGNVVPKIKVVCLNDSQVFESVKDAYLWATGHSDSYITKICRVCKGKDKSAYKHPETGEKLVWRYKEDYDKMTKEEIETLLNEVNPTREITDSFNELNENVSYTQNMFKTTLEDKLSPIYNILSPAQTYVFNEYFLNGNTMQEIAERHNVTTTRIGNLTKQVIAKITNTYSVNEFINLIK